MSRSHHDFVLSQRVWSARFKSGSIYCRKCGGVVRVGDRVVSRAFDCTYGHGTRKIYHVDCWEACFI